MGMADDVTHAEVVNHDSGIFHDRLCPVNEGLIQLFGGKFRNMHRFSRQLNFLTRKLRNLTLVTICYMVSYLYIVKELR